MKKTSIAFIILSVLLGLGILFSIIGIAMGGTIHTLSLTIEKTDKTVSHELKNISLTDDTDIQKLDLDLSAHSVKICTGSSFSVTGGTLTENKVENGTWHVQAKPSKYLFSVWGYRIRLPFYGNDDSENEITITIPDNITLQKASLELSAVNVSIGSLNCNSIQLNLSAGASQISDINAQTIDASVSAGNIEVDQFNITQKASFSGNMADIQLGTDENYSQNICNNLDISCTMGSIEIFGKLTGKNALNCTMGSIDTNLIGSKYNYNVNSASSTLGEIDYKDKKYNESPSDTTLYGTLDLDCTMGDITVSYH